MDFDRGFTRLEMKAFGDHCRVVMNGRYSELAMDALLDTWVENRNKMNITSPQDMASGTSKVEEAVSKFEEQFAKQDKDQQYYHLVIIGEYSRQCCDEIEQIYTSMGWSSVKCRTSSENGERGGLTGLQLSCS